MKLSISVCTYNRSKNYERVVASLKSQLRNNVELVSVEGVVGLAKARNIGWRKAKGEYVAYIDDDAIATSDWVKNILNFIKLHPDVKAFGGPYISSNQSELPAWIPKELTTMEVAAKKPRPIRIPHEWLTGTNMIFRRDALKSIGGFGESLGVTPTRRAYGEETDLLIRLHNAGHEIWYDPKIKVVHEFSKQKQSFFFLVKDQFTHGLNSQHTFKNLQRSDPGKTANTMLDRLTRPGLSFKTRAYFLIAPLAYILGMLVGRIRHV